MQRRSDTDRAARFGVEMLLGSRGARSFAVDGDVPEEIFFSRHGGQELCALFNAIDELRDGSRLIDAYARAQGKGAIAWMAKGRGVRPRAVDLAPLYEAGHMVSIRHVERFVPALVGMCRALEADLELRVGCIYASCFLSKKKGIGAVPHVDRVASFNVQLTGEKRWFVGGTPVRFPERPRILREPNVQETLTRSFVVRPGSVVFVPPGVVHATEGKGEEPSLAIGFSMESRTVAERLGKRILRRFQRHEALRAPPLFVDEREARKKAAAELRALADRLMMMPSLDFSRSGRDDRMYRLRVRCVRVKSDAVLVRTSTQERQLEVGAVLAEILELATLQANDFSARSLASELPGLPPSQIRASLDALERSGLIRGGAGGGAMRA